MKLLRLIPILLVCSNSLSAQVDIYDEANNVFSSLFHNKRQAFLSPQLDNFSLRKIREELSTNQFIKRLTRNDTLYIDTLTISAEERVYIDNFLKSIAPNEWTNEKMKQTGLSSFTLIDKSQAKRITEFDYIIYEIMQPVFIRNNTVCIAYYSYSCGRLCGHGELSILFKKNGKWLRWWTISEFDS